MLKAIHKETGKLVSTFQLIRDPSWVGRERDEFIAPKPEISNWRELIDKDIYEVKVSFIKEHIREKENIKIQVIPHFRINNEFAKPNSLNESEEHLLSKEGIYEEILYDTLIINNQKISEIGKVIDVDIEHRLSKSTNSKIADVYLRFDNKHEVYGYGIVFEIQFSYQNKEIISERTYDRVLQGYSVCWLFDNSFKDNKLKNKNLEVIPYTKAIKEFNELCKEQYMKDINRISRIIDDKLNNVENKVNKLDDLIDSKIDSQIDFMLEQKDKIGEMIKNNFDLIKDNCNQEISRFNDSCEIRKEKIFFDVSNDQVIIDKLKDNLDINKLIDNVKLEIFNQIKVGVLDLTEREIKKYIKTIDPVKIERENYHEIKKEVINKLNDKFDKLQLFHKCSKCHTKVRFESSKILGEEIVCGNCYFKEVENHGG